MEMEGSKDNPHLKTSIESMNSCQNLENRLACDNLYCRVITGTIFALQKLNSDAFLND
jgi:hypothetical protein